MDKSAGSLGPKPARTTFRQNNCKEQQQLPGPISEVLTMLCWNFREFFSGKLLQVPDIGRVRSPNCVLWDSGLDQVSSASLKPSRAFRRVLWVIVLLEDL